MELSALALVVATVALPFAAAAQSASQPGASSDPAAEDLSGNSALNWAGYASSGGTYTAVSGTWTVPVIASSTADGSDAAADATWVGIGGVTERDLIQAGTEAIPDGSGGVAYRAWYELLPDSSTVVPLDVNAGDVVKTSLSLEPGEGRLWRITIANETSGETYSTDVAYDSSLTSAEWIEEVPAGVGVDISLDQFGSVAFTGGSTTENGASVSIAGSGAQPITMVNADQATVAMPSSLGADGASFAVTRTDAQSTSMAIGAPRVRRLFAVLPMTDPDGSNITIMLDDGGGPGIPVRILRARAVPDGNGSIRFSFF